jgi:hypothetical protein
MPGQDQKPDQWPTILWIAWTAGDTEHRESLCRAHREYIFSHYPASAHGLGRRGIHCTMCRVQLPGSRAVETTSDEPKAAASQGQRTRGSRRRVSPIRHSASSPPARGGSEHSEAVRRNA